MRGHGWVMEVYNFNPRSREGSDRGARNSIRNASISIHAPAKGATSQATHLTYFLQISIHAPAKGAT